VEQHRAAGARARLGQHLRREHAERAPEVDELRRQRLRREASALDDGVEAHLLRVRHAVVEDAEHAAVVQVGHVHDVAAAPQLLRELPHALGEPVRVVEHDHLRHHSLLLVVPIVRMLAHQRRPRARMVP